jgi:hypothetical protein
MIKQNMKTFSPSIFTAGILTVLSVLRLLMGQALRYYFISGAILDDKLLVSYAYLRKHFQEPGPFSLVKTMSYPLFLYVIHKIHISYAIALSLVWIAAAFCFYRLIQYLFQNRIFSCIAFSFILFHPVAYHAAAGLRIYRNALIAPFVLMTFCQLLLLFFHLIRNDVTIRVLLLRASCFSILLLFTYFIKEDGIWIAACLLFFMFVCLFILLIQIVKGNISYKKGLTSTLCAILPLLTLFAGTKIYKAVNYKYFQVAEIQTRTEGELGKFVSNAYQIESPEQTYEYTVPASSIKKMYEVSPTFQTHPELLDSVLHASFFYGDIEKNPIQGDFLTWVLRISLIQTNIWQSEKQVNGLFHQINSEVDTAFENGQLQKSHKIKLLSSAVGRTPEEISTLFPLVGESFRSLLVLKDYKTNIKGLGSTEDSSSVLDAIEMTSLPYLQNYDFTQSPGYLQTVGFFAGLIRIYRIFHLALVLFAVYGFIASIKKLHQARKQQNQNSYRQVLLLLFTALCFLGISLVYAFAISWFSQFLISDVKSAFIVFNFYATALIPLLSIALFFLTGIGIKNAGRSNKA